MAIFKKNMSKPFILSCLISKLTGSSGSSYLISFTVLPIFLSTYNCTEIDASRQDTDAAVVSSMARVSYRLSDS